MNAPSLPLRPLGTGELLDRALTVYRAQFKELFKLSLAFALLLHLISKAFELLAFTRFPALVSLHTLTDAPELGSTTSQIGWFLGAMLGSMGLSLIAWQASVAAVSTPAEAAPTSAPLTALDAWHRLRSRLMPLLGTLVLELVVLVGNVLLGALPFALAVVNGLRNPGTEGLVLLALGLLLSVLLMTGLFLVALLRYLLVPCVVIVEGLSGWKAISRASLLMRGRGVDSFWLNPKIRGSLVMLVLGLASNAVLLVATAPRSIALMAGAGGQIGPVATLLIEAVEVLASAAIQPFGMVTLALFYLDLRVRREGLDLELTAARLRKAA